MVPMASTWIWTTLGPTASTMSARDVAPSRGAIVGDMPVGIATLILLGVSPASATPPIPIAAPPASKSATSAGRNPDFEFCCVILFLALWS